MRWLNPPSPPSPPRSVTIPMVLEIPSRDAAAGSNDPIMKRVLQMLGES